MYGLVNHAFKTMIIQNKGEETWIEVCESLGLESLDFNHFEQYEDQITLDVILEYTKLTNQEAEAVLESFGKYWVEFTHESEYQTILHSFAPGPVELIESLDALHSRLELTFDNLSAPSFWTERETENKVLVYYSTTRELPLQFFVVGLLKGIFKLFDKPCKVEIVEDLKGVTCTCAFRVTF
jgi:hypothetical protein